MHTWLRTGTCRELKGSLFVRTGSLCGHVKGLLPPKAEDFPAVQIHKTPLPMLMHHT